MVVVPVDRSALAHREQMLILFAVVIVHVQRANARFHDLELMLDSRADVGVARVENVVELQVRAWN